MIGYAVGGALPFVAYAWLGPKIRDAAPDGVTLTDWVRERFGRPAQAWVGLVSVFYMFMFITAELTAIGAVLDLLGGVDPWVPIVLAAGVTAGLHGLGWPARLPAHRLRAGRDDPRPRRHRHGRHPHPRRRPAGPGPATAA